jgi:molybdopterin-guanine dinucleotide biosynthesis protein A
VISKGHKKHTDLTRPSFGNFNRNEWAFVGGKCDAIKLLAGDIIKVLSSAYKCAYADTSHNDDISLLPGRLASGAVLEYTDQVNYNQLNYQAEFNAFKLRETFSGTDLVLVNGNHQQARAQVVIICESKKASLQKRVEQLTNVQMILLADDADDIFPFIKDSIPNWQELPLYRMNETEKIISFFQNKMQQAKSVLNGLVLAGGKSERMGFDKGAINLNGKEQRYHVADLLKSFCNKVYISCRQEQQKDIDAQYLSLPDTFTGLGPFGAILSAFREKPDNAWLVVACDLPLLDEQTFLHLTSNRNVATIATAYQSTFDGFPEPLVTIWEPKSYPVLLSFLSQGYSCPRKVLINSEITLLNSPNPYDLTNMNTPEELEKIKLILNQKIAAQ